MTKTINKTIFQNRNREAGFWEKNFSSAWKKGKPVKTKFSRNLSETITERLQTG
jgi:hypothetical protein